GKIQRGNSVVRSACGTWLRNECGWLRLDQCRLPRTAARVAERDGGAAGKRAESAAGVGEVKAGSDSFRPPCVQIPCLAACLDSRCPPSRTRPQRVPRSSGAATLS